MLRTALAVVVLALLPAVASAQDISPETLAKLRELYSQAQTKAAAHDHAGSNKLFLEILGLLPAGDMNRPHILGRINENFAHEKKYDEANAILKKELEAAPKAKPGDFASAHAQVWWMIASNEASAGKKDAALGSLEKAAAFGFSDASALATQPAFESMRDDKRFTAVEKSVKGALRKIGFGLVDLGGKKLAEKDFAGKVLVLDIWGTWCPPCRAEIPHFIALQKKYESKGFSVIGLTWERRPPDDSVRELVKSFAKQNGMNYPVVLMTQDRLGAVPDLTGFPTTLFFGRDGTMRKRLVGLHDLEALEKEVATLIAEKPPKKGS